MRELFFIVAVDRILKGLLKLGFRDFVRIGSIKKISKSILPFTSQQFKSSVEGMIFQLFIEFSFSSYFFCLVDINELNLMLETEDLTPDEKECIQDTIEKFKGELNHYIM